MIARSRFQRSFGAPSRLVVLAFAAAVAAGALLFALPLSNADGAWHLDLKTLFLATSACCVTGLDPVGVGAALTPFGLAVLGVLVELGGLGIMTIGTFLVLAAGRSLSVDEERSVMNTLGTSAPRQVGPILRQTVAFTLGIACRNVGMGAVQASVMSATNLTSAGEFAADIAVFSSINNLFTLYTFDKCLCHDITFLPAFTRTGAGLLLNCVHLHASVSVKCSFSVLHNRSIEEYSECNSFCRKVFPVKCPHASIKAS